ncbi:MAG: phosphate starvation-inducible PhoH-like protein [Bradymonadia bacterium]
MADSDAREALTVDVPEGRVVIAPLFGPQDTHRRFLEKRLDVRIKARGERISITGKAPRVRFAKRAIDELIALIKSGAAVFLQDVEQAIVLLEADTTVQLDQLHGRPVLATHDRRGVTPKSPNQAAYLDAIAENDLVFGVGPAGTGKTYLAMAAAVAALKRREVERIILARPAVEAGERLGFLPGSLIEKVNPYLRPLYDALFEFLGVEQATRLIEQRSVEVAPLAFMRGRTLNRAFVVLDEAQNTTREQMKMFLTRLGNDSRAVITGDITQVDLPRNQGSGLAHAIKLLKGIDGIAIVRLTRVDVVRHPLVRAIVQAYEEASEALNARKDAERLGRKDNRREDSRRETDRRDDRRDDDRRDDDGHDDGRE